MDLLKRDQINLIKDLTSICLFLSLLVSPKTSIAGERWITFLPSSHAPDEDFYKVDVPEDIKNEIVEEQLAVARFIENNPGTPVFSEQAADQDYDLSIIDRKKVTELRHHFDLIFPQGLPEFSELTDEQKNKIYNNRGDFVQLIRGKIQSLHRVIESRERSNEIFAPIKAWTDTNPPLSAHYPHEVALQVYGEREREALTQINNYFEQNPDQRRVILLFGSNHNFQFYSDLFPPECVHVPHEFQDDWSGKLREGPYGFSAHRPRPKAIFGSSSKPNLVD